MRSYNRKLAPIRFLHLLHLEHKDQELSSVLRVGLDSYMHTLKIRCQRRVFEYNGLHRNNNVIRSSNLPWRLFLHQELGEFEYFE
jgi:hypothetical protein